MSESSEMKETGGAQPAIDREALFAPAARVFGVARCEIDEATA